MSDITETQRLTAIEAIRNLKARRIQALDLQDWDAYEALHWPEHVSANEGEPEYHGAKANTARLREGWTKIGMLSVHHVHSPDIRLTSATTATGVWAMEDNLFWKQGEEEHWLRGYGFYYENYEQRGGEWKFIRRQLRRLKVLKSEGAMLG